MRPRVGQSWYSSLGARLLLLLLPAVSLVFIIYAVVSYRTTRSHVLDVVITDAHRTSQLIHRATHYAMLLNRKDDVERMLQEIASGPGVEGIRVFDKSGLAVFSTLDERTKLEAGSQLCRHCHEPARQRGEIPRDLERVVSEPHSQLESLHHLDVIVNEEGCTGASCHGGLDEEAVLGVLEIRMSLDSMHSTLDEAQRQLLSAALVLILLMGGLATVFVHRVVQRPVALLSQGTRRIADGHLGPPLQIRGRHELARLANDFNVMTEQLQAARQEIVDWSQTLENKVVEKTQELQRTQRQVVQMDRMASLGKLSATVAHELNNPIGGILTYAKLVERGLGSDSLDDQRRAKLERYLHLIQRECTRCGDIVRNLLVFAKRSGSERCEVDLRDIVERSWMLVQHHLELHGLGKSFLFDLEDSRIHADGGQIEQALLALLINAIESMADRDGEIRLEVTGDADWIEILVGDEGIGIEASARSRIFEPFFSTKDAESGVGLGLSVVYGIVQRHQGEINVESEPGVGTEFRIHLPRHPPRRDGASDVSLEE